MSFPLAFPSVGISKIVPRLIHTNAESTSPFTGQQQIVKQAPAYWSFDLTIVPQYADVAVAFEVWLHSLQGIYGTFYFDYPVYPLRGAPLGAPKAGALAGDRMSIASTGWTASKTGLLLPGDWIQFPNYEYKRVTTQVDSDGSGNATINFMPEMRTAPTAGTAITTTGAKGIFRLTTDIVNVTIEKLINFGATLVIREAF